MVSHCLVPADREPRVLDASQIDGPDPLADILSFLGVDEDVRSAMSSTADGAEDPLAWLPFD